MGVVYRPRDVLKGRKEMIKRGLQDLSPGMRDTTLKIFEAWEGKRSEEKLVKLLGKKRAKRLIKTLRK